MDAEQWQSRELILQNMRGSMRLHEQSPRRRSADKRVSVEAFPSFQEQGLYVLLAHLLSLVSEKGHRNLQSGTGLGGAAHVDGCSEGGDLKHRRYGF